MQKGNYIECNNEKDFESFLKDGTFKSTRVNKTTNKNYAFDFVIKSKKIIIEYNDLFWHARHKDEWKNPMVTYEESHERDANKKDIASKLGFDIIYVWSDNLPDVHSLKEIILK
jgi:very-short-patch-repair endonuclease